MQWLRDRRFRLACSQRHAPHTLTAEMGWLGGGLAGLGDLSKTVQWHIETLYSGTAGCAESNAWLTAFVQQAPEAWDLLIQLLSAGAATTDA